jgi:hypothetical protein
MVLRVVWAGDDVVEFCRWDVASLTKQPRPKLDPDDAEDEEDEEAELGSKL